MQVQVETVGEQCPHRKHERIWRDARQGRRRVAFNLRDHVETVVADPAALVRAGARQTAKYTNRPSLSA
jgi:hypothetical protein